MEYIVEVPDRQSREFINAMKSIGLKVQPLHVLEKPGGESGFALRGAELGETVWEINQFLSMLDIDEPRVPEFRDDWSPERASALMDLAKETFTWNGTQIVQNRFILTQEEWERTAERHPLVFHEPA